jgi:N-acetylmuramic acid 6-phosphate (MurNAc-6-P) etherase
MQSGSSQPISERVNERTRNIDVVGPEGIVRLLRQCDSEMFTGWEEWEGLSDESMVEKLEKLADSILPFVRPKKSSSESPSVKFIMSGAGTSGRLSHFCARNLNKVAEGVEANVRFEYLMAGHDLALIKSQEKAEDDVVQSIQDLKKVTDDDEACEIAVYIGITCGLSAPYVGSQINWILNESHPSRISFFTVLLGFNHSSMARKTPIEGYSLTMHDIVSQLQEEERIGKPCRSFLLNPILGPEPIAGSSRMKGGSATKMVIEMIAARVLHRAFPEKLPFLTSNTPQPTLSSPSAAHKSPSSFFSMLDYFQRTNRWTYMKEKKIASLIALAGQTLKNQGHLYYLSNDSVSMMALIDASECPPTYGADFEDIRAFVPGGWSSMLNLEGDMSHHGLPYQISEVDFESNVLPNISKNDLIIVLHHHHNHEEDDKNLLFEPQPSGSPNSSSFSILKEMIKKAKSSCPSIPFALISWSQSLSHDESIVSAMKGEDGDQSDSNILFVEVSIPEISIIPGLKSGLEISAKWILNAISTGAHILKGKVWSNRMIDLNLSNDKLFRRGITLVSSVLKVSEEDSKTAILKSIHFTNSLSSDILNLPISSHYQLASKRKRVIPVALLLASGKVKTVEEASNALSKDSILRNVIASLID